MAKEKLMKAAKSPVLELITRAIDEGKTVVLATVISADQGGPAFPGMKLAMDQEGRTVGSLGREDLDSEIMNMCFQVMKEGRSTLVHHFISRDSPVKEGIQERGKIDIFLDLIEAPPTMVIFGAGHIAQPLSRIGKIVGYRIVIVDDREHFASRERFPEADDIIVMDFNKAVDSLNINPTTYLVLITRGHKHDEIILRKVVGTKAAYIGMIGSRRRVAAVLASLMRDGYSQKLIDRVHAPIGLRIGSQTPEEIALSIAAEVVKLRREGEAAIPKQD
jgi:xanthine dehydrogenase accessory factor